MVDCFGKTEEVVKVWICEKCRIGRRAGTPLPSSAGGLAQRVFRQFGCLPPAPPPLVRARNGEAEAAPKAELPLHLFMRRATVGIWWGGGI